jgi:hypothetical protein
VCDLLITCSRFFVQKTTYLPKTFPYARHKCTWEDGVTKPFILKFGTKWTYLALRSDKFSSGRIALVRTE